MPPLPQYNRQTRLNGSPLSYEHYNINADTSGASIAKAGATIAQGINNLTNSAMQINEMQEEAKLVKGYNAISQWEEENLHDKENGYYYKTGIDAAGKSQEVIKSFDDFIEQYKSQNRLSVPNQQRLDRIIQYSRNRIVQGVNAQDFKQTGVWAQTEGKLGIDNAISHAVSERNNPENIKVQLANIRHLTKWQGKTQGLDKSTIDLMTKNNISDAHCSVIQSLIAEGNLSAKDYFENNKDEISSDKQAALLRAVTDLSDNYTARDNANYMAGLQTQDAYKFLDGIENPDLQDKTEREYNQILRRRREIESENDKRISAEIMEEVYTLYDNGGGNISDIMAKVNRSDLSLDTKEKIYKNLKNMQELEQAGNNWADYNYLLDMAGENNEMFKNINPAQYNLTKEQYQKIVNMQRDSANVQYTPEVQLKKIVKEFDTGFNPITQHDLNSKEYQQELVKFLSKVERLQGKAFDINHLDNVQLAVIMNGFEYKDPNAPNKNIDEVKELYMRAKKHGEVYDRAAYQYVAFKQKNKREPEAVEMYEIVKGCYNTIENEYKNRAYGKVSNIMSVTQAVNATIPKSGETKVLTYMADKKIPEIGRELGIKYTYVDGARYRAGDKGGHGKGRKLDVSMSEHSMNDRIRSFEAFAADPCITSIGTSDPIILKRFAGNPKVRDLRQYDANYKKTHPNSNMNHVNHFDISFDTRFGGDYQGNGETPRINHPAYISTK